MPRKPYSKKHRVNNQKNWLLVPEGTLISRLGEPRASVTYLRVIVKGCKGHHVSVSINDCDCQVSRFDKFKNFRIWVYPVVNVVFSDLNKIDDRVAVVRIRPPQNDAFTVKLFELSLFVNDLLVASNLVSLHSVGFLRNVYKVCFLFRLTLNFQIGVEQVSQSASLLLSGKR